MLRRLTLLLSLLVGLTFSSAAFQRSYYAEHSRLASGTWVKIKTTEPGIYQLTYKQLREMGFANPARVQVYGYSATNDLLTNTFSTSQPDDLQPVATKHTDSKILFYGMGDCDVYATSLGKSYSNLTRTRTPYDVASYYFLSDSETPIPVPQRNRVTPFSEPVLRIFDTHLSVVFHEEDIQNEAQGGVVFHGKDLMPGGTSTYEFNIPGYAPFNRMPGYESSEYAIGSELTLHNRIGFRSQSQQMPAATYGCDEAFVNVGVNDQGCYPTAALISFRNVNQIAQFAPVNLEEESPVFPDKISVSVTQPSSSQEYLAEDYQALVYPRSNALSEEVPALFMTTPTRCNPRHQLYFPDVEATQIEVWNVSNPYKIDKYPLTFTNKFSEKGGVLITMDANSQRLAAFLPECEFPSPTVMGAVEPQDLHGLATPDMVIITTTPLLQYAEQLADLHRKYQGMDVAVVEHNLIFNEFSSGARSAMAYRRFLKMLLDRDQRLSHVLFFGPCNFDNRGVLTGKDVTDQLVLWSQDDESDAANLALNYALDARMGMLQDDYTTRYTHPLVPMQLAVGRLKMGTDEAPAYVAKATRWFTNPTPPEVYNNVLIMGGAGDNHTHLNHAIEIIDSLKVCNPGLNIRPIHTELYLSDNNRFVAEALKNGIGFFEYSGHGNPVSTENWSLSDAKNTEYTYPVIAMISSCDQFALDHDALGLVTTMLSVPDGGAIAAVAASRGVYINHNQRTAVPFSVGYATARPGQTIGEIYRDQRNKYVEQHTELPSAGYKNITSFNLGGDPAIPVYAPSHTLVLETIDGREASDYSPTEVAPFAKVKLKGYVADAKGQKDTGFSGPLTCTVYDAPRVSQTHNRFGFNPYTERTISDGSVVLARQLATVENGQFEFEMVVSGTTYTVPVNRIILTSSDESGNGAIGVSDALSISNAEPSQDQLAELGEPSIISMEIEVDPASVFDPTGAKAVVKAVLDPSKSGLELRTSAVNSCSNLTIDGSSQINNLQPYLQANEEGLYILTLPVTGLTDGVHTACLTVISLTGATASLAQDFTVLRERLKPTVLVDDKAVSEPTEIDLDTTFEYVQLEINNAAGLTVFAADNVSTPFKWDLRDSEGKDVPDGRYNVVVRVRNGSFYGSAKGRIIVLK